MPKVTKYAAVHLPDGETVQLSPGDDLPEGVDADALNPALFEDEESDLDEDGNPTSVSGPGVTGPPEESEDEAKDRKAAEAKRKREQRAAKKASDEEAQRLADEREKAEAEAAAEAKRQQDATGQQDQGGGS